MTWVAADEHERLVAVALEATLDSARAARDAMRALRPYLTDDDLDDVRLMVSELVSNSVRHGSLLRGDAITVTADLAGQVLTVDVADLGAGFSPHAMPVPPDRSGWGLFLVDRLAKSWGFNNDGGATHVWFQVERRE